MNQHQHDQQPPEQVHAMQKEFVNPFPPELRTASIIPRWSVVWTLNRDTVANHSYYVAVYAHQIARLIQWDGHMARLLFMALTHDLDETVTGDIVSPVKKAIVDIDRYRDYVGPAMHRRMPDIWSQVIRNMDKDNEMAAIVNVADRLDAVLFLTVERRMGNLHIIDRCNNILQHFNEAWYKLPAPRAKLEELMRTVVIPAVEAHNVMGGNGV